MQPLLHLSIEMAYQEPISNNILNKHSDVLSK